MANLHRIARLATAQFLLELRRRLLVLIGVAVVPLLALVLYQAKIERELRLLEAQESAWRVVDNVALRQARFIDAAHQLLQLLADTPDLIGDRERCRVHLRRLVEHNPLYVEIGSADEEGQVRCSSAPQTPYSIADRTHFRLARASGQFAIGDFHRSTSSSKPVVEFGYPVRRSDGEITNVLYAGLSVRWISELAAEHQLPPGAALSIVDSKGTLLVRHPDPEAWFGRHIPDASLFEMLQLRSQRQHELIGLDGVARLYAFKALNRAPKTGQIYVMVGVPKATAFAEVYRAVTRRLMALLLLALGAVGVAWFTGSRYVIEFVKTRAKAEELRGQLAAIVESSEDAIIGMDLDGIVTSWNAGAEYVYGYSTDEMLGKNIEVLIQPDNRSEIRELMNIVRRGKGINRYESGRVRKDGRVIDVSASLSPTKDLDGRVTGAATITRDISLQRKGEAQLLAHTMQLEALHGISQEIAESLSLAEMMPRALKTLAGILPFEFAFAYCATRAGGPGEIFAAERRTDHGGYVSQELQNSLDTILRQVNAEWFVEDVAAVPELAGAVMSQGVMSLAVMPLQAAERTWGNLAVASRKVHPFTVEEVQFLRALARQIALGLENARLYEASLEFNRELAGEIEERKRAEKQLANFHAMVVHDLRAPLSNVISMTESVREGLFGAVNELQKKWLGKIETNCRSLIENVSDVLDVAKIEAGQLDIKPASMDLAANVREAVNEYSVEADKRGIRLVLTVDDDLPLLRADARRIDQVLTNLLSNALKFTKAGGEIRVAATRAAGAAVVSVADTGVGIPADEIGKLFEMYRQSSNHRSTEQRSSGVGLVICKKIVEGHGGRIWVDSVAGHGSKFSFSLPVAAEARDWATPA